MHAGFEKLNKSSGAKGKLPGKSGTGQGRKSKAKAKDTPKKEAACVGDLSVGVAIEGGATTTTTTTFFEDLLELIRVACVGAVDLDRNILEKVKINMLELIVTGSTLMTTDGKEKQYKADSTHCPSQICTFLLVALSYLCLSYPLRE